jgi:hypothetical protein
MPGGVDDHWSRVGQQCRVGEDASDICIGLADWIAETDGIRITGNPLVADVDVVIARGDKATGIIPQSDVPTARGEAG